MVVLTVHDLRFSVDVWSNMIQLPFKLSSQVAYYKEFVQPYIWFYWVHVRISPIHVTGKGVCKFGQEMRLAGKIGGSFGDHSP